MRASRAAVAVVTLLALLAPAACGTSTGGADGPGGADSTGSTGSTNGDEPFTLPVGPSEWDVTAPAWLHDGTLHVGERAVELGDDVDEFVLGATGVYWMRGQTLMFTSAEGRTQRVERVGWGNLAVSADRSVLATVDQSRGPTDRYGTHVIQVAVFDTRTGEQLYRTPDEEPRKGDDLADLYSEIMPLLHGVSRERVFFDGATIDLADGSAVPTTQDADGLEVYDGYADTLFPDGYHVGLRGDGARRELDASTIYGGGLLSPDRTTVFDTSMWPTPAVVYDATTGERHRIDAPWDHFTLAGWSDEDTFYGVAEHIERDDDNILQESQVVTCELRTLACTPVSPVVPNDDTTGMPRLLVETDAHQL